MRSLACGRPRTLWLVGTLYFVLPAHLARSERAADVERQPAPITMHVLNSMQGKPAVGLTVVLSIKDHGVWKLLARAETDEDGRVSALLPADARLTRGIYQVSFTTGTYFRALGLKTFYPEVPVIFEVTDPNAHYHLPLILSPYGYSTYRGS